MKKLFSFILIINLFTTTLVAQNVMTPEQLIQLGKVSAQGISKDGNFLIYAVSRYDLTTDTQSKTYYKTPIYGGATFEIQDPEAFVPEAKLSPDGKYQLLIQAVKTQKVSGKDYYEDAPKSNVRIYNELNYRHWDTWEDGHVNHLFYKPVNAPNTTAIDIMKGEAYDCPQKPFGGSKDYCWSPDGSQILYVSKKLTGTPYTLSTNSDIYAYNLATGQTSNLTAYNPGYDTQPAFSKEGQLAWLQMKRDGYEADKNDLIVLLNNKPYNLTKDWDGTVSSFLWDEGGEKIYFVAPTQGTYQVFEVEVPQKSRQKVMVQQLTKGQFNASGFVGQSGDYLILNRTDMNHAKEIYTYNLSTNKWNQITHANDAVYDALTLSNIEKRMIKTTDGKDMLTWIIYPPNFDPAKKYPTLLYCQGGPQSEVSQFYSFRWNFQIMAAHGYIVVAPNRRGLPGFGVAWNEQISKDYGGQNMQDYLSAIDEMAKEPYVDENRLGAVGASYGGYSIYFLAGHHEGRFKSFIAHDGIFNQRSMYGTTEELFFVNWDLGGPYWDIENKNAQMAFLYYNPINFVYKWDTPILIFQGEKDYRVPMGQALEAFQAAQLKGIKSRLILFPDENHWVLQPQNSLVWQREFFRWLRETL